MELITHEGRTILYFDYRGLDDSGVIKKIGENEKAIVEHVGKGFNGLLRLTDIRGLYASEEVFQAFKDAAVRLRPHFKASAVVGITGAKKVLLDVINRVTGIGVRPFDDIEQAKDWLVKQS